MSDQYYHTEQSVEEYIKAAEGHSGKALIEQVKQFLPPGSTLLELGSGPGTDWAILSETYAVTGSDYSVPFVKRLETQYPNAHFLQLNAATLDTEEHFQGIYSNKVLHHLTDNDLSTSIQRQHDILNPDGIICHSFWKGEGGEEFKGMFVNYHNEAALNQLFNNLFEVLVLETYAEFEPGDSLLLIARKQ